MHPLSIESRPLSARMNNEHCSAGPSAWNRSIGDIVSPRCDTPVLPPQRFLWYGQDRPTKRTVGLLASAIDVKGCFGMFGIAELSKAGCFCRSFSAADEAVVFAELKVL